MASNLHDVLRDIVVPEGQENGVRYYVVPVNGYENHFFGRSSAGQACLLLATARDYVRTPVRLSSIEVSYAIPCNIALIDGSDQVRTLTAIVCTDTDRAIQRYFAHVCETLLRIVGKSPSLRSVVEAVNHLVDLFQKLSRPPRKSAIGLFAELLVISVASEPKTAVGAWRNDPDDRFDFATSDVRIEVKASGNRERAHNFSLEQCMPPSGTCGLLISLFVEPSGGGTSLLDLIQEIESQIQGDIDLMMKFQEIVTEGLGEQTHVALSMRFDVQVAKSSMRVYELDSVPKVPVPLPRSVSRVRFRSDISGMIPVDTMGLKAENGIVKAMLPSWI